MRLLFCQWSGGHADTKNWSLVLFQCFSMCIVVLLLSFVLSSISFAATKEPEKYEDEDIRARLITRTPEQMAAFYMGRGFDKQAIHKVQETCFITAIIKNKNVDVLWLELDNWIFSGASGPIKRINRNYWKKQWQDIKLPLNHQSTFGWTLMPEVRDLRRDESVGGNVVIPKQDTSFDMTILFKTGSDKKGKERRILFRNIMCGIDEK